MAPIQSPSAILPPLGRLHNHSAAQIVPLLKFLRTLYEAPVAGSKPAQDSGYASEASDEEDEDDAPPAKKGDALEVLRADRFERGVAMKWLVGLVARGEEWAEDASEDETEYAARSQAIEDAAALLSAASGIVTGALMRTFQFPLADSGAEPISIHLRDASILSQDHTSVGLQTWGSSCILGQRMAKSPSAYDLLRRPGQTGPMRILELGAGTGLMSMVLAKLLKDDAQVIATDYHPAVLDNLRSNISGNFSNDGVAAPEVLPLDWRHLHSIVTSPGSSAGAERLSAPFDQPFDHIIGADIIYEQPHADWIKSSVQLLLKRGSGIFHLIMPARPTHEEETASVPVTFPRAEDVRARRKAVESKGEDVELAVLSVEEIDRIVGTGRMDEMRYFIYRIGWA